MKMNRRAGVVAAAALAAALLSTAAWADHGKAGLWRVTVTLHSNDRALPQMSASDRAQMKALGVEMPNNHTVTTEHCMTEEEVKADALHAIQQRGAGCVLKNRTKSGQTYSADMVCNGEMKGQGHVTVTYDTNEHYSGKMTFRGTSHGRPADITNLFDGSWIAASCGNVRH